MARVFYVGAFSFPTGDAAAARVLGIGKALRAAGHEVVYAGSERAGRATDELGSGSYSYQGFQYFSQDEFRSGPLPRLQRLAHYFGYGTRTLRWLASQRLQRSDVVIVYGGRTRFLTRLAWLCHRSGVRLIADRTEWYDPRSLVGGRWGIVRWDEELNMRGVTPLIGHVIAISSYLARYYQSRRCRVIRVPPLVDLKEPKWDATRGQPRRDGPMRLVYRRMGGSGAASASPS